MDPSKPRPSQLEETEGEEEEEEEIERIRREETELGKEETEGEGQEEEETEEPRRSGTKEPRKKVTEEPRSSKAEELRSSKVEEPQSSKPEEPRISKAEELRSSKVEEPRNSKADELRSSKVEEPRSSKAEEPRSSKGEEPRDSKAEEPRSSKAEEPRSSKAEEPRSSKAEEARKSKTEEPRKSEAEEARISKAEEPRSSKAEEPRKSETQEPRNSKTEEPRRSGTEEPRKSETKEPRRKETEEPRKKETEEPRGEESEEVEKEETESEGQDEHETEWLRQEDSEELGKKETGELGKEESEDEGHEAEETEGLERQEAEELENADEEYGFDEEYEEIEEEGLELSVTETSSRVVTPEKPRKPLSSDAESSVVSEDEFERPVTPEVPPEYWQVQRLVKYVKAGNPTATIIAMSSLRDFNLRDPMVQTAIKDAGGLEVMLNILDTDENRCKIASLLILRELTTNTEISRVIFNMKGVEALVAILRDPSKELKLLSAEVLANIGKIRKARRALRKGDGINRLVDMLDIEVPSNHIWHNMEGDLIDFDLPRCGALALWSLAKSTKNKDAIRKAGAIPLISKLLRTKNVAVVIPVVGILHECASEASFRLAIRTEGLLSDFVDGLRSHNHQLVQFCASAIHMCAEDPESREIVYQLGAVDPLINIIKNDELRKNKPLLGACTGAIWKCASSIASAKKYLEQGLVELLVSLVEDEPEYVLANVAGAIEQIILTDPENAVLIKKAGAIPPLIGLLTINNPLLLVNATKAVGQLARNDAARREMDEQDGFRLVWSLLKHPNALVQASAAWSISPYVLSSKESADQVRNFVGGLEAMVHLLKSDDIQVQAAVSQAVSVIAKSTENLAIMTDHGVCEYLARLATTKNDMLRRSIAEAIADCCKWKTNAAEFGRRKAVSPICMYLASPDPLVHRAAARALAALSTDPRNCITMHQCGVVDYLINMIGSADLILANAAADVIYNIRMLAMAAERVRLR